MLTQGTAVFAGQLLLKIPDWRLRRNGIIMYKKNYPIETGRILREKYEIGVIWNEYDFKEVLNNVLSGGERS